MTEPRDKDTTARQLKTFLADARVVPMLNYALLFFMTMTVGATGIVALLVCTFAEDGAPDWIKSHYRFQLRTFWIGIGPILATIVGTIWISRHTTNPYLLGLIFLPAMLWVAARVAMGFNHLLHNRPYPNPTSWMT